MNPGAAVAAIITYQGDILFGVRAHDPQVGKLDLPGGFVDNHETGEQALRRELHEELGLKDVSARYMASFPNTYHYAGVDYQTLDLIYVIELGERPSLQAADDILAIRWIAVEDIPFEQIAFDSARNALRYYTSSVFQRQ
jgi:ADP-ribose pyrophosphatase YjhB (NUDIX family)